jgi:putative membrane protein
MTAHDLPAVNASLNALSALFLTAGYVFIRRKNKVAHRNCMVAALVTSIVFLACYLTYHFNVQTVTRFRDPEWFRPIYLVILLTHTVLATVIAPMILITLYRAWRQDFEAHKRIARWTWPLWMYVSVTGVLVYLLLYQIFPQT